MQEQSDYALLFAQRQEHLFIEYVRKAIDLEVRLKLTSDRLDSLFQQHENSENIRVEALSSLEKLSVEHNALKETLNKTTEALNKRNSEYNELFNEKEKIKSAFDNSTHRIKDLEREIERQNQEMNIINAEKGINKKKVAKRPDEAKVAEEDIF